MSFEIRCDCCPDSAKPLMSFEPATGQSIEAFNAAWKAVAPYFSDIRCEHCDTCYTIEDDGVDIGAGGSIVKRDITRPGLTSLDVTGGPREGGTTVVLTGKAFNTGTVRVFFGTREAGFISKTDTSAVVVTPPGSYSLLLEEGPYAVCSLVGKTGNFSLNELFTGASPACAGSVRYIYQNTVGIWLNTPSVIGDLEGCTITGATSGAAANIASVAVPRFVVGEQVTGATNGSQGVIKSFDGRTITLDLPTGPFSADELIVGEASGARGRLGSPAYSGAVDVRVENEYGVSAAGGTITNGFTYS